MASTLRGYQPPKLKTYKRQRNALLGLLAVGVAHNMRHQQPTRKATPKPKAQAPRKPKAAVVEIADLRKQARAALTHTTHITIQRTHNGIQTIINGYDLTPTVAFAFEYELTSHSTGWLWWKHTTYHLHANPNDLIQKLIAVSHHSDIYIQFEDVWTQGDRPLYQR